MPLDLTVVAVTEPAERSRLCASILRALPHWFGIESATRHYIEEAAQLPTFAVGDDGFLCLKQHFAHAAEIYVMGVQPALHRRGIGRALIRHAEAALAADGVEYVQVKTLGPSDPDEPYARTRRFYEACGFRPLEELRDLWPDNPCLVLVKRIV